MFKRRNNNSNAGDSESNDTDSITVYFEDRPIACRPTDSVAAAVLLVDPGYTRRTPVNNAPRAPYCMMGVCFECLMEIDGVENQQACMILVRDGMQIRRQDLMADLSDANAAKQDDGAKND
ncbi:MAG: (2Fe-2S)-binding protein [Alphaproteobacteria bacterium]|nr:(2Fe-2S)-binding protein [Alphaproteobacteria bacterium]